VILAALRGKGCAVQPGAAAAALRLRVRVPLARVRVPGQPPTRTAGLPAAPAVLPQLALRFLTLRAVALFRPDRLFRIRRFRI